MNYAQTSPLTRLLLWLIPLLLFVCVPFFGMALGTALAGSLILLLIAALSDPLGRWLVVLFGLVW